MKYVLLCLVVISKHTMFVYLKENTSLPFSSFLLGEESDEDNGDSRKWRQIQS